MLSNATRTATERRAVEERERREVEELQVRPVISEYAASLVRTEAPWERLSEGNKATKIAHLAQIKQDLERKELADCTFRWGCVQLLNAVDP